jgi:ubiquinone/menaquinone biosynthesis C-methylase UbiE
MENTTDFFEANREGWNKKTEVHKTSAFYDLEGWRKGNTSLQEIELRELGDVNGKKLLHLQCHFGQDTLSWARLGAKVTGCDFSETAIKFARQLSKEEQNAAKFVCCNVYDLPQHLKGKFDIVFTSYGTIGWLPDLDKWATVVAHFLTKGGTFYIADFHPVLWMLDDDMTHLKYAYHKTEPIISEQVGSYADRYAEISYKEYGWNHSLGEVINALIAKGLRIDFLNEYPYSPYDCFSNTVRGEDGNFRIKGLENIIPMVYSIKATKG